MILARTLRLGKSAMWEFALVVLQVACLAILVAAAIVSISLPGTPTKGPEPRLKRTA
jgi:hypothetical protein